MSGPGLAVEARGRPKGQTLEGRRLDPTCQRGDCLWMSRPFRKAGSFTLVEILVVVAIIGLLAGISVPAVGGALASARKAKTMTMAHQIRTAIAQFNMEYGYFPTNGGAGSFNAQGMGSTDAGLALVLSGSTNDARALTNNPRTIAFLEVPLEFTRGAVGNLTNGGIMTPANLYRSGPRRGQQVNFSVSVDSDYDGNVRVTNGTTATNTPGSVHVWIRDPSDSERKTSGTWK